MKLTSAAMNANQESQRFPASGAAPCYVAALFVQPTPGPGQWARSRKNHERVNNEPPNSREHRRKENGHGK